MLSVKCLKKDYDNKNKTKNFPETLPHICWYQQETSKCSVPLSLTSNNITGSLLYNYFIYY